MVSELFTDFGKADRHLHRALPEVQAANPRIPAYVVSSAYIRQFAQDNCTPDVRRQVLGCWLGIDVDEEDKDEAADASGAPAPGS